MSMFMVGMSIISMETDARIEWCPRICDCLDEPHAAAD